jgi:4-hydroxyphenylpyruvate dioxygenase-like putative hemolysin
MDKPDALFNNVIQIGIVVSDLDRTIEAYRNLLQLKAWNFNHVDTATGKGTNFHNKGNPIQARAKIAWVNLGSVELELIEPRDQDSPYAEFLEENGQGVHHIMLGTSSFKAAKEHMSDKNIDVIGGGEFQDTQFQMFDTAELLGFICEVAQGGPLVPDRV